MSTDPEGVQLLLKVASVRSSIEAINTELTKVTREITNRQIKYSQNDSALYGGKISSSKELQELQSENAHLKEQIPIFEEQLMSLMVKLEETKSVETQLDAEIELHTDQRSQFLIQLAEETAIHKQELGNYQSQRSSLWETLPQDVQTTYTSLRKAKSGIAVTEVKDDSCGTCGADISKSEIQQTHGGSIVTCQGCGRIIFAR